MSLEQILFLILGTVILLAAAGAIFARRIMHAALLAVVVFTGVGGVYALLGSPFIAGAQVLIYIGAVAIVLLFAVMLSQREEIAGSNPIRIQRGWRPLVPWAAFAASLFMLFYSSQNLLIPVTTGDPGSGSLGPATKLESISGLLFKEYLISFEVVSLILLLVLVGTVVVARKENDLK